MINWHNIAKWSIVYAQTITQMTITVLIFATFLTFLFFSFKDGVLIIGHILYYIWSLKSNTSKP